MRSCPINILVELSLSPFTLYELPIEVFLCECVFVNVCVCVCVCVLSTHSCGLCTYT